MLLKILIVTVIGLLLWVWNRYDAREYRKFKELESSSSRQKQFLVWTSQSFCIFGLGAFIILGVMWHISALSRFPNEFEPLRKIILHRLGPLGSGFLTGIGIAMIAGMLAATVAQFVSPRHKPVVAGDIELLLPRNAAERWRGSLLSLNAGLSEELFFRLALPLLLVRLTGSLPFALLVSILTFGFIHAYQGAVGIFATTYLGAVFAGIYGWTGNIWICVLIHALIDLRLMLLQSWLSEKMANRQTSKL